MLHKVIALDTYTRLSVTDINEKRILEEGFEFEVDDERLKTLLGDNAYKVAFVKLAEQKRKRKKNEE